MKTLIATLILTSLHLAPIAHAVESNNDHYCRIEVADDADSTILESMLDKKYISVKHSNIEKNGNPPALVLLETDTHHGETHFGYHKPTVILEIQDRTGNTLSHATGKSHEDWDRATRMAVDGLDNCEKITEKME